MDDFEWSGQVRGRRPLELARMQVPAPMRANHSPPMGSGSWETLGRLMPRWAISSFGRPGRTGYYLTVSGTAMGYS